MQPQRAVFLTIFHRVAISKHNNPYEQFETNKILPDRRNCSRRVSSLLLIHAGFGGYKSFSGRALAERAAVLS
jgi:hypothetical protein